jgi:putative pyruvate formate lyase activating enzyme
MNQPGYLKLLNSGELFLRVKEAKALLRKCSLCPRLCGVDRASGVMGLCRSGLNPVVASYNLHFGEEPPLSGENGSGTIFFSNCTMRCRYCQNFPISQLGIGRIISVYELGRIMLKLKKMGAHNINIVTGTHFIPQIIEAIYFAALDGLDIPIVYNTSGYERIEILKLLDGIIDIYLPDIRYSSSQYSRIYSSADDYVVYNRESIKEMYMQVGELKVNHRGIAERGLIVRHLILPDDVAETEKALRFLKSIELPEKGRIYISIMTQYFPAYRAVGDKVLGRKIKKREMEKCMELLTQYNIWTGWVQDEDSAEYNKKICM